jgi:hypothetical protein
LQAGDRKGFQVLAKLEAAPPPREQKHGHSHKAKNGGVRQSLAQAASIIADQVHNVRLSSQSEPEPLVSVEPRSSDTPPIDLDEVLRDAPDDVFRDADGGKSDHPADVKLSDPESIHQLGQALNGLSLPLPAPLKLTGLLAKGLAGVSAVAMGASTVARLAGWRRTSNVLGITGAGMALASVAWLGLRSLGVEIEQRESIVIHTLGDVVVEHGDRAHINRTRDLEEVSVIQPIETEHVRTLQYVMGTGRFRREYRYQTRRSHRVRHDVSMNLLAEILQRTDLGMTLAAQREVYFRVARQMCVSAQDRSHCWTTEATAELAMGLWLEARKRIAGVLPEEASSPPEGDPRSLYL